jgi:subtilisin-like proprotein convertase family protein
MKSRLMIKAAFAAGVIALACAAVASGAVTNLYSSGNVAKPITDFHFTVATVHVKNRGRVKDVNAYVRLNHTYTCDLSLGLIAPNGKVDTLSEDNCTEAEANYGTGRNNCSGQPTIFNDSAMKPITGGVNPYSGSYKPQEPLSMFNGSQAKGAWRLVVNDNVEEDTGRLGCVKLRIKRKTR